MPTITGTRDEGRTRRALGQEPRVVPAVADRLLAGARGALDEQRRIAADRRRQVLKAGTSCET